MHVCNNCDLDQTLQKFWLQEELPKSNPLTAEEQECEDHYRNTYSRNAEGRYVLLLPFKNGRPSSSIHLSASVHPARSMLLKMEKRLLADSKLKEAYQAFLKEYADLGHMRCVGISNDSDVLNDLFSYRTIEFGKLVALPLNSEPFSMVLQN